MPIRFDLSALSRRLSAKFVLVSLIAIVVSAFVALSLSGRERPNAALAENQPYAAAQATPAPSDIKVARLTLRPHGFEPKQMTHPKKTFYLMVENRSGIMDVNLRLDRVAGGRLHEGPVKRRTQTWIEKCDLPPGSYRLSVAERPDWICDITITP
jgi:hypothetical protein